MMLADCQFPPHLAEPYATALQTAIPYILDRFAPVLGIIVAGSVLRGQGDPSSDLDVFVIFDGDYRQRVQKYFHNVPFEIFANPPKRVPQYFEEERHDGGGSTLHMLATGFVMLNRAPIVDHLRQQAQQILAGAPEYRPQSLLFARYMACDRLENALDCRHRDPAQGHMLLGGAMLDTLVYFFQKQGKWIPRHKDMLVVLRNDYPDLARLFDDYALASGDACFEIATQIADIILGTRGFFEWESDPDKVG